MSNWYELTPRPDLPFIDRMEHWPHDKIIVIRCCVCAPSEERGRELATTEYHNKAWSDPKLSQARLISEKEFVIGSS